MGAAPHTPPKGPAPWNPAGSVAPARPPASNARCSIATGNSDTSFHNLYHLTTLSHDDQHAARHPPQCFQAPPTSLAGSQGATARPLHCFYSHNSRWAHLNTTTRDSSPTLTTPPRWDRNAPLPHRPLRNIPTHMLRQRLHVWILHAHLPKPSRLSRSKVAAPLTSQIVPIIFLRTHLAHCPIGEQTTHLPQSASLWVLRPTPRQRGPPL